MARKHLRAGSTIINTTGVTPLIPSTFPPDKVAKFGSDVPLGCAGEPGEIAPCFVLLASEDSRYMTGQVLHPNGGEIVNA